MKELPDKCPKCGHATLNLEQTGVRGIEIVNGKRGQYHAYKLAQEVLMCDGCGSTLKEEIA